jgi:hypothetical protein
MAEFWDTHDLGEYGDRVRPAKFDVDIETETTYYPLELSLSNMLRSIARRRGISPDTLLNLWIHEKVHDVKK